MQYFYKQPDEMDCGPICLRMAARHHGRNHSIQRLRELTEIGKDGVNMLGIAEADQTIKVKFLLLFAAQKQTEKMKLLTRNELKAIKGGDREYLEPVDGGGTCRWWVIGENGTKHYSPNKMYKSEAIGTANEIGAGAGWCCDSCPH